MSIEPMDPERLALLRLLLILPSPEIPTASINAEGGGDVFHLVDELLRAHDHWQVEAARLESIRSKLGRMVLTECEKSKRWRSRCPVAAADVEAAGVTNTQLIAWMSTRDQQLATHFRCSPTETIEDEINEWSERFGRPAHDILDEMAALGPDEDQP